MKKNIVCCLSDDSVSKDMDCHHNPEFDSSDSDSDLIEVGHNMMLITYHLTITLDLRLESQMVMTAKSPVGRGKITADTILHPRVQLPEPYCESDNGECRCCKQ
jgi:hypothetical protein